MSRWKKAKPPQQPKISPDQLSFELDMLAKEIAANAERFHAHRDNCMQCYAEPWHLCPEGAALMREHDRKCDVCSSNPQDRMT